MRARFGYGEVRDVVDCDLIRTGNGIPVMATVMEVLESEKRRKLGDEYYQMMRGDRNYNAA